MSHEAKQDPLFNAVKQLVITTRTTSVEWVCLEFEIGCDRAASMLDAMEGDVITPLDAQGMRRVRENYEDGPFIAMGSEEIRYIWYPFFGESHREIPANEYDVVKDIENFSAATRSELPESKKIVALDFAFLVWLRGWLSEKEMKIANFYVPTRCGWQRADSAIFGSGWAVPNKKQIGAKREACTEYAEELASVPENILLSREEWPCAHGREESWIRFLKETGVRVPDSFSTDRTSLAGDEMHDDAKQDPLFEAVKQMVIETRTPSIALTQRTFLIGYSRAASMLDALEGDVVTPLNERGLRRMLTGETNEYL